MVSYRVLPRALFAGPPDRVAAALLGKLLVRRLPGLDDAEQALAGRIVETEAYFSTGDPAAHAAAGRTERNRVLWGEPGHAYVYFIYGRHACLNVSCEPEGEAGCVLFRALEPIAGLPAMAALRGLEAGVALSLLASGPGRLCQAMGITRANANGLDMLDPRGELVLAEDEASAQPGRIVITPRIGITKAADRPLRFFLAGNACVSGPRLRT